MPRLKPLLWATAVFLACPIAAQEEGESRYFSLLSNRTFGVGEKASVTVSSSGLGTLEFRVYRVNDPRKFFEQLEDPHQFGGQSPRPARELTWLERFEDWKQAYRSAVRDAFRAQFTRESRTRIHEFTTPKPAVRGPASFALVPLLNQQQLVTKFRQSLTKQNPWDSVTVPLDLPKAGVYLVEATNGVLRAYTIVSVSNYALITKSLPGRVVTMVVDRQSGAPAANCDVSVVVKRSRIAEGRTNALGLVTLKLADFKGDDVLVMATPKSDFAINALPGYSFHRGDRDSLTGYVYTDRPVYRPGHKLGYRAIVRAPTAKGYDLPSDTKATVEITDPEGKSVFREVRNVSGFGTIHGDYAVPDGAALGMYSVEMKLGESKVSGNFEVEEYKKPEYEVKVTPNKKRFLQGTSIEAEIEAKYYFGEPVAGAAVKYVVYRSRYWAPWDDAEDEDDPSAWGQQEIAQFDGKTNADGKLSVSVENPVAEKEEDRHGWVYRIEGRVTDAARREISGSGVVVAPYASYSVTARPNGYVYAPGQTVQVKVNLRDLEGAPVAGAYRVEVLTSDWREKTQKVLATYAGRTFEGEATTEFPAPASGSYRLRVVARTPEGRDAVGYAYLWVEGGSESARDNSIEIVPDKKSYRPGETAKVLIVTGVPSAHVLLSVEGRDLHQHEARAATSGSFIYEIPIRQDYAPNFYVSAAFIQKGQLYQGTKSLKVPPTEQKLNVKVTPSKAQFKPGEAASYSVEAKDWQGKPVSAELSLGVVDEAIYAIRPETMPDPLRHFYGRVYSVVSTESSLSYFFSGEAGERAMLLAQASGRSLAQLKPDRMPEPRIRKAFPDTVYWAPAVVTGADGRATAKLEFPDSLTTWRATARGVTRDTRVGQGVNKVIVRKNLILRPAVPRFFTEEDEVTLTMVVQNYLEGEKSVKVTLEATGLELLDGGARDVTVASKGTATASFRVRAKSVREATILAKALSTGESDAVELKLPVKPFGVPLSVSRSGALSGNSASTTLEIPAASVPQSREVELRLAPSIGGALFGALDYLTTFPYGCTEQTMSSVLPNLIVAKAFEELKLKSAQDPKLLQAKVNDGLDRLLDFQHPDGGWGWWQTDDSSVYMTALVVEGFSRAAAAGFARPNQNEARDKGAAWLKKEFEREERAVPDARAYMVYALGLAGQATPQQVDSVWAARDRLSPQALAQLALELDRRKDARLKEAVTMLEKLARQNGQEAWWNWDRDDVLGFVFDTSTEATAMSLKLLARVKPESPLVAKAALWLTEHRNEGYWWSSTKQTAMAVDGLTEYLKRSGELAADFTVNVDVNGKRVLSRRFTQEDVMGIRTATLKIPASLSNQVSISRTGNGRLYWSARANYYSTEDKYQKTGKVALNLLRDYFRLVPSKRAGRIVYQLERVTGELNSGDIVASRLTLTGGDWRYLLLEDPLPAGVELIERDDLYELADKPDWWTSYSTRRELRDDRAALFKTYFSAGQGTFFSLFKVVNPGKFRASPARVMPMYQPEYLSTTESLAVQVKP
ncbi:MAG: alpha-2-macroglobulin [Bryobacteraceae bacterium]|nr:alpha-2-macroglobulin [Bryobacteraceae bacterium]